MSLLEYNKKRDFEKTNEPAGIKQAVKEKERKLKKFVIQYHRATTNHFDFRLEYGGVLISFAVPKGLPNVGEKRLAVKVEDHPLDYINFSGTIPKGQYGAGTVEIYDKGRYDEIESFKSGLKKGKLKFCLIGKKFNGVYALIKLDDKNWLFIKDKEMNNENPYKKTNKKDNKKIDRKDNKKTNDNIVQQKGKSKNLKSFKNPFNKIDVKLCLLSKNLPKSKNYIYEIKYDGYRIVAYINKEKVTLKSRNNKDFTDKFKDICESLKNLGKTMVLDGEVVVFDEKGRSDFGLLQSSIKNGEHNFAYVVFDILALNGEDLRDKLLIDRKILLEKNVKFSKNIILSNFVKGNGKKILDFAKTNNLEGVVAKNENSVYDNKRDENWIKIKCYLRQEFVIIGFKITQKNKLLSAIFVGYYEKNNLIFAGKVGTGFSDKLKKELNEKFLNLTTKKPNIKNIEEIEKGVIFLKPKLVSEIKFAEITKSGKLRQASFVGLREDKKPKMVVNEFYDRKK